MVWTGESECNGKKAAAMERRNGKEQRELEKHRGQGMDDTVDITGRIGQKENERGTTATVTATTIKSCTTTTTTARAVTISTASTLGP